MEKHRKIFGIAILLLLFIGFIASVILISLNCAGPAPVEGIDLIFIA